MGGESTSEESEAPKEAPQPAPSQAKEQGGKNKGLIIGLVVLLIIIVGGILFLFVLGPQMGIDILGQAGQPSAGPPGGPSPGAQPEPAKVPLEEAQVILIEEVLEETTNEFVAHICDEPLQSGDVVYPEAGQDITEYTMDGPTYLAYIDDEPNAFFAHDVRYVFINGATGETTVVEASWWPIINDESIWEAEESGNCNMVRVYAS